MAGLDLFDCVLILRTQEAVDSFASHKVTIGSEISVAAGVYGGGTSIEMGVDRQPVMSYVKTRGLCAFSLLLVDAAAEEAVSLMINFRSQMLASSSSVRPSCTASTRPSASTFGLVSRRRTLCVVLALPSLALGARGLTFLSLSSCSQLSGRTRAPREAEVLFQAIDDAESGAAQRAHGLENEFFEELDWEDPQQLDLHDGETLKLPPTPEQLEREEEDEEWRRKKEERDKNRFLR